MGFTSHLPAGLREHAERRLRENLIGWFTSVRPSGQPGKNSHEHPVGRGPGRGPARGRARAYRLVTFGQSFHWTDEQQVAETVCGMLEPGGALALIVHTVTGRPRPPDPGVPAILHDEIKVLVEKYLGATRRAGQGTAPERTHRFEDVLARIRFGVPRQLFVPGIPDLLRDSCPASIDLSHDQDADLRWLR